MLAEVNAAVDPLRIVLEDGQWRKLKTVLHAIPTRADTPRAVETIRVATDILIEECAFSTAFERAFVARRALHKADVASWIHAALTAVHPVSIVARRLVTLIESLATTEKGRTRLGRARIVDALIKVWKRAGPRVSHVPAALCALCSGHIDNISRVMRYGGIAVAEGVLHTIVRPVKEHDSSDDAPALTEEERRSLECTLLLFGLLCICIPDKRSSNTQLVPVLRDVIRASLQLRERNALTHAMNIIGNIAECWRKEGRGFALTDCDNLAQDLVSAWTDSPRHKRVVCSAAWALTGLVRTSKLQAIPPALDRMLQHSSKTNASVRALRQAVADFQPPAPGTPVSTAQANHDTSVESVLDSDHSEEAQDRKEARCAKRVRDEDTPAPDLRSVRKRMRIDTVLCTPQRPVEKHVPEDNFTPVRPQDIDFDADPVPLEVVPKRARRSRERRLPANYSQV